MDHSMHNSVGDGTTGIMDNTPQGQQSMSHDGSMQMQMWFVFSSSCTILFKQWHTQEPWQMALSCFLWFMIAFMYEVLKAIRQEIIIRDVGNRKCTLPVSTSNEDNHATGSLENMHHNNAANGAACKTTEDACPCADGNRSRMSQPAGQELVEIQMIPPHGFTATSWRYQMLSKCHLIQTLLHLLQMGLSYILMLVVMTFNAWLFLAVILGFGAGYFVCGWWHCGPVVDPNEHCH